MSLESNNSGKLSPEILAEVKRLHFQARRLANEGTVGQYRSAFKGRGIEFEEVREYVPGDEIRTIDWKVTARSGKPYVKSYREERELSVLICIDVSGSTHSGTGAELRGEIIGKLGAVLTLVAIQNNDKVGLVTFSDRVEKYFPPRKVRSAAWRILHEVLAPNSNKTTPATSGTDLRTALEFVNRVLKRRSIIFVISDFIDSGYEKALATLVKRHDVTAVSITDPLDTALPETGLLEITEPESQVVSLIDCSSSSVRTHYANAAGARLINRDLTFRKLGVGHLALRTDKPFIKHLRAFLDSKAVRARHV